MKRSVPVLALLVLLAAAAASSHDLFLKPHRFFVDPDSDIRIRVLNGTFTSSEGAVARARLRDLSMISPLGRLTLDSATWLPLGDTSVLSLRVGKAGTYVVGASTLPRSIRLGAKDFNSYLASDGLDDVLAARRRDQQLELPAHEEYSKHVKTILQVGKQRTAEFAYVFGYPAELVPLDNPYSIRRGVLRVRALLDLQPIADQLLIAGGRTVQGRRIAQSKVRTDGDGVARISLTVPGYWYVKFIHMVPVERDSLNYESKWATLTFEVR